MVDFVRRNSKNPELTRPQRVTNIKRRKIYKKTCQRRFDAQRKRMGSKIIVKEVEDDLPNVFPDDDILVDLFDDDDGKNSDNDSKVTVN